MTYLRSLSVTGIRALRLLASCACALTLAGIADAGQAIGQDLPGMPAMPPSAAASSMPVPAPPHSLTLNVSQGTLVTLPAPAASLIVADPDIANAQIPLPNKVFVFGRKPGTTTIYALSADGSELASIQVSVTNNPSQIRQSLRGVPNPDAIRASGNPTGFTVQGTVPNAAAAAAVTQAANAGLQNGEKLNDQLTIRNSAQVMIHVRIAEVSRTVMKNLGINWQSSARVTGNLSLGLITGRQVFQGGEFQYAPSGQGSLIIGDNGSVQNVIDALESDGLITVLAEPTLITLSGQPASFLVGGEFPIPISQGGNSNSITIEFKQYGVSLNFLPTVYANNHINIRIRPEVSELTTAGAITLNGVQIPGLQVRRADTTIELGSGESFALAGLLQNDVTSQVSKFPGLGDLPILGSLFRSTSFQRNETELVIIATPYIAKPIDDPAKISLPTDGLRPASDVEQMLLGRLVTAPGVNPGPGLQPGVPGLTTPRLVGDAGFSLH